MYIINFVEIAYHQHAVLYIIKPQERYTLTRDDMQPKGLMIYTTASDDIPSLRLG